MSEQSTPAPVPQQPQVEYRDVPDWPGYRVGDDGSVWSRWRRGGVPGIRGLTLRLVDEWRRLKPHGCGKKLQYHTVDLWANGTKSTLFVHHVVLAAFVGPCPEGLECRHLNGDSTDNRVGNICWGTRKENAADRARHGTLLRGEKQPAAKLSPEKITLARSLRSQGGSYRAIARNLGVCSRTLTSALQGKTWKHVPAEEAQR